MNKMKMKELKKKMKMKELKMKKMFQANTWSKSL